MSLLVCGGTHEEIDAWAALYGVTDYVGVTSLDELPASASGAMYLDTWPQEWVPNVEAVIIG